MKHLIVLLHIVLLMPLEASLYAQTQEKIPFPFLGKIQPRHARDITSSNWSIGAETMDRNYTVYQHWKDYLGPLGFKKARVQAGWARTEQAKGVYDWNWLDEILFDMPAQGVKPWVNLGYGNAIYANGGGTTLFGSLPESAEALKAWDLWVRATVSRYQDIVDEWEVWNEPNYRIPAPKYADFLVRTAENVKSVQPDGKILAFGLGSGVDYQYADSVLSLVAKQNKLHLIDEVSFHRHQFIPEDYENVDKLQAVVRKYDSRITIRQTESGAPTVRQKTKALHSFDWNEQIAAKWALRRLLGDLGRDIPSSYFGIMEMKYPDEMNSKGVLKSRDDQTVERPKTTYSVLQYVSSTFDDRLERIPEYQYTLPVDTAYSLFAYRHQQTGEQLLTVWLHNGIPQTDNRKLLTDIHIPDGKFSDPVYVDLLSGAVYRIPKNRWTRKGSAYEFRKIPVYDSPVLITDKSNLHL
jgi:hypothetical protein